MSLPHLLLPLALSTLASASSGSDDLPEPITLTERVWHLGNDKTPEWPEAPAEPEGSTAELEFEAETLAGEGLLVVQQRHIDNVWRLELNGVLLGNLETGEELVDQTYEIPPGTIVDGTNKLVLVGETPTDDITFGRVRYHRGGWRELLNLRELTVRVLDAEGAPSPARVTVTDADGELVRLFYAERLLTAVRQGVVYTAAGTATFEVPPGSYEVHASRGTEWSMGVAGIGVGAGAGPVTVSLQLVRELDTTGYVAADTHVHTLTYSGHGDSSVEERLVTLAGEGVELAIATDHNHNTDYAPLQNEMGLDDWFTPAVGNEVSTPIGHLNAFPLDPDGQVPPYDLKDIVQVVEGIRAAGAEAVILNHPRWPSHTEGPHGTIGLDQASGAWTGDWACPFDALELVNSQTEEKEPLLLFRDWFALMNRGERLVSVGSSDSHTVGGVVGQGRTYIAVDDSDVGAIDVSAAAKALREGRSSISMGIFVDVRLPEAEGGASVMGEVHRPRQTEFAVQAPSWVTPRRLRLFANGTELAVYELEDTGEARGFQATVRPGFDLGWPMHDFWMVVVVEGDGVGSPAWPQINDYTLAATNPVYFDVDGDGEWRDPRELARLLVEEVGVELEAIGEVVGGVDDAVAVQYLGMVRELLKARSEDELWKARTEEELRAASEGREVLEEWLGRTGG